MQFTKVTISGVERWAFSLTKWEATAFVVIGKNKKAPEDEQAVRFGCYGGRPIIWATDGTHMLSIEPSDGDRPFSDLELNVQAQSLKTVAAKARVNQMIVIPIDGGLNTWVLTKRDIDPGEEVTDDDLHLPLEASGVLEWTIEQLVAVDAAVRHASASTVGSSAWETAGRFASTLAAVAKATGDVATMWVNAPHDQNGALTLRIHDELDGARWRIVIMPR